MKKKISSILRAACFAAAFICFSGLSNHASAAPPVEATITDSVFFDPDGGMVVSWSSTGAFSDSGTAEASRFDFHGEAHRVVSVHTSSLGSFTIAAEVNLATHDGHWVITEGTGAYASMHGSGTVSVNFVDDSHVVVVHAGQVILP